MSAELAILNKAKNQSGHTVVIPDYKLDDTQIDISEKVFGNNTVDVHDVFNDGSCIATYQFNNSVKDLGGNYNGNNNGVTFEDGVFNKCGTFNGSSRYVNLENTSNLTHSDIRTVSCWINLKSYNDKHDLFCIGQTGNDNNYAWGYLRVLTTGELVASYIGHTGGMDSYVLGTNIIELNKWYFVTGIYPGIQNSTEGFKLYINGVDATGAETYGIDNNPSVGYARIGTYSRADLSAGNYVNGNIDQLRIFNKALTQEEVTHLYTEGTTVSKYSGTTDVRKLHDVFDDNSAVATYTMDGNVKDLGGNYDGTPTNISYGKGIFYGGRKAIFNAGHVLVSSALINRSVFTLTFWNTYGDFMFGDGINGSTYHTFLLLKSSNQILLEIGPGNSAGWNTSFAYTRTNKDFIELSYDNNNRRLIIKQNLVTIFDQVSTQNKGTSQTLNINNTTNTTSYSYGDMDQLRIFNRALTEQEIETLYTETIPRPLTVNDSDVFRDNSILAHYKFDGNALDETGNYDGTPTDVVYVDGKYSQASKFNGTSSGVKVNGLGTMFGNPFSISMSF